MKKSAAILEHLVDQSQFKPLRQHRCYRLFLDLLPPRFRQAIAFVTIKNRRLLVGLRHPGYKMELNYNQELLKSLLSTLREHRAECAFMEAESVVLFASKYHPFTEKTFDTVPHYQELAVGEFEVLPSDERLRESFESIRRLIRQNRGERE
ncbi:DciA family protein [Nitratifractor sp.]